MSKTQNPKRGRPATGCSPILKQTISDALAARLDASAFDHLEERSEAVRRLLSQALDAEDRHAQR